MKIPPRLNEVIYSELDIHAGMTQLAVTAAAGFSDYFGGAGQTPNTVDGVSPTGARFRIPLVAPVEHLSGDNRHFEEDAISHIPFPIPVFWQPFASQGHDGAVIVGRIDYLQTDPEGGSIKNANGVFDIGPWAREAERLVRAGFLRHVSVDLDEFEGETPNPHYFEVDSDNDTQQSPTIEIKNKPIKISKARINGVTLVGKPAFQECFMVLDTEPSLENGDDSVADGIYEETPMDLDSELAALAASAAPLIPPRDWFGNPNLREATPLTITDDGRVFGHIAAWSTSHIGLPRATKPPRSMSNYAYFRTGALRVDDGSDVSVGQLTLAGGHAPLHASAQAAAKHYDDTNSAVADVSAGEDQFGIWVAGALRPDITPSQVRAFRASAPSGDWRPINGRLELVAVCAVNVPGFPIARAMVAGGQVTALVAAGASAIAELRKDKVDQLAARLDAIESAEFSTQAAEAAELMAASVAAVAERREAEFAALMAAAEEARALFASAQPNDVDSTEGDKVPANDPADADGDFTDNEPKQVEEMAELDAKKRDKLSKDSFAIPSERKYPINDREHAANAKARVEQYGTPEEKAKVNAAVKKKYPDMSSAPDTFSLADIRSAIYGK